MRSAFFVPEKTADERERSLVARTHVRMRTHERRSRQIGRLTFENLWIVCEGLIRLFLSFRGNKSIWRMPRHKEATKDAA